MGWFTWGFFDGESSMASVESPFTPNYLLAVDVLVCRYSMVFFRAQSFQDAIALLTAMTDIYQIILPESGNFKNFFAALEPYGVSFDVWHVMEPLDRILSKLAGLTLSLVFLPNLCV